MPNPKAPDPSRDPLKRDLPPDDVPLKSPMPWHR